MKILLIEDNKDEAARFQEYFCTRNDVELIGVTGSASEGLLLAAKHYPDAIILDIELDEGNGIEFLPALNKLELPVRPYVVVTTWTSEHRTLLGLKQNGAGYVQIKSKPGYSEYGPQMVHGILKEMEPYFVEDTCESKGKYPEHSPGSLEELKRERIKDALGRIQINRGSAAQTYLIEAIYVASVSLANGAVSVDMENIVYPALEKKFGLARSAYEKGMRTKIEYVWRHVDPCTLAHEYTQYIDPQRSKPVLRDFIAYYADKFK